MSNTCYPRLDTLFGVLSEHIFGLFFYLLALKFCFSRSLTAVNRRCRFHLLALKFHFHTLERSFVWYVSNTCYPRFDTFFWCVVRTHFLPYFFLFLCVLRTLLMRRSSYRWHEVLFQQVFNCYGKEDADFICYLWSFVSAGL